MSKKSSGYKPPVKVRELPPRLKQGRGDLEILCPFCDPPHPIAVGKESRCGTQLRVTAIQTVFPARTVNRQGMTCIKCGKGGGEMVKFNQTTIHLHECTPDARLMAEEPEYSRFAQFVFGLPAWVRRPIEKRTGYAKQVAEIDPDGNETGRTAGYFFYKGTGG